MARFSVHQTGRDIDDNPVGGLYSNLSEGLTLPFEATYGFLLTLGLMVAVIALAARLHTGAQSASGEVKSPALPRRQERGIS
jgi:hypothetical protein